LIGVEKRRLYQVLEKSCTGTFEELELEMKSPSDGSCTERWLPTFFLKVCKNSFLPLHIFGGLSTAFKVDGCFADSLDPQVPTLMLLRKLVAQKRCPRKFPRCFLPQNSGDGLSQKFVAGLGLEIQFEILFRASLHWSLAPDS